MKCVDQEKIFSRKKKNVLRLHIKAHRAIIDSARIRREVARLRRRGPLQDPGPPVSSILVTRTEGQG